MCDLCTKLQSDPLPKHLQLNTWDLYTKAMPLFQIIRFVLYSSRWFRNLPSLNVIYLWQVMLFIYWIKKIMDALQYCFSPIMRNINKPDATKVFLRSERTKNNFTNMRTAMVSLQLIFFSRYHRSFADFNDQIWQKGKRKQIICCWYKMKTCTKCFKQKRWYVHHRL